MNNNNKKELVEKIKELYDKGYSFNAIGKQLDISPSTVAYTLKKNGVKELRSSSTRLTEEEKDLIIKEFEIHKDIVTVSNILKQNSKTIEKVVAQSLGIFRKGIIKKCEEIKEEFLKDYYAGMKVADLKKKYKISNDNYYIIKSYFNINRIESCERKNFVRFDYFKELNSFKAYLLGYIFYAGSTFERATMTTLLLTAEDSKDMLETIRNEVYFKSYPKICRSNNVYKLRIGSNEFIKTLHDYGFLGKINIPSEYIYEFVDGFLSRSLKVSARFIRISCKKDEYLEFMKSYLLDYVGIKNFSLRPKSIIISSKSALFTLGKIHPILYDKIYDYLKTKESEYLKDVIIYKQGKEQGDS